MTGTFQYIRRADEDALGASLPERYSEKLLRRGEGGIGSAVAYIRTPPGGGSPEGTHTHEFDQIFYVLDGTMTIEVEGERMIVDLEGSAAENEGSVNSGVVQTRSAIQQAFKFLVNPSAPVNGGNFRNLEIRVPQGSCFDPSPTAA